jgi:hypothetical protein
MAKPKIVRRKMADGSIKEYVYQRRRTLPGAAPIYLSKPMFRAPRRGPGADSDNGNAGELGIVYFFQVPSGPIKIGFTHNLRKRFIATQTHNHESLALVAAFIAAISLEDRLLWMFRDLRIHGEWHRNHERIHKEIERLAKELKTVTAPDELALNRRFAKATEFAREPG